MSEGTLECPDEVMDQWLVYRFGCTKSTAEREAVMDICLAMLEDAAPSTQASLQASEQVQLRLQVLS